MKMTRTEKQAWLLGLLYLFAQYIQGSAVDTAPVTLRQFVITTAAGTASVPLLLQSGAFGGRGPSKSVLLINDSVTAGEDIHFNLNTNTSVTPVTGTAGSFDCTLKPGERINIDGKFNTMAYKAAAGTPVLRAMISY